MYKAYVFDFDYTLANSEKGIVMCFEMLLADEGYPRIPKKNICQTIGMTMHDAVAELTGETDDTRINELVHLYKIRYSDKYMTANTHLYAQTRPALEQIKAQNAFCCIVSTKTRSRINQTLQKDHLEALIDLVVGIEDVQQAKPAPDGIQRVQQFLKISAQDILYIGDNLIDAQTAVNSGVDFAGVTTGTTTAADFKAWPHVLIMKDLGDLP
ncbi:serine kinase [Megasphaera cerevisiae DSM 20462]|uniref:Serine kinase n=1 Tax=Megasphaera cerevisiae DSM 20462 TaxID=1122219 RepID=A0A0J6WT71_9FIRM|nr:HAD-IA family hydrolase [Megasphaera cerevisiae]KMO85704.1 serine kinase [Megasphaera cerevisiae DSM 20462]SKA11950.1 phosphoglycolate phosphatase [Megasphaera cerevisiae DSM 20462]